MKIYEYPNSDRFSISHFVYEVSSEAEDLMFKNNPERVTGLTVEQLVELARGDSRFELIESEIDIQFKRIADGRVFYTERKPLSGEVDVGYMPFVVENRIVYWPVVPISEHFQDRWYIQFPRSKPNAFAGQAIAQLIGLTEEIPAPTTLKALPRYGREDFGKVVIVRTVSE